MISMNEEFGRVDDFQEASPTRGHDITKLRIYFLLVLARNYLSCLDGMEEHRRDAYATFRSASGTPEARHVAEPIVS
jgi:hypothetical protein